MSTEAQKSYSREYNRRVRKDPLVAEKHRIDSRLRMREKRESVDYLALEAEQHRGWKKRNPERARFSNIRQKGKRRTRLIMTEQILTQQEWGKTLAAFGDACAYCGKPWRDKDHLIPVAMGGDFGKFNIVPSCAKCNLSKSAKNPFNFKGAPEAFMVLLETHL